MKNSHLKSGFIFSYAAIFIQSAVSLIYTPVLLRLLGGQSYGLLQLAISTIASLSVLSFGFTGSYMRFYAPYRANKDFNSAAKLNGMFLLIFLAASFLSLIAGSIITANTHIIFSRAMTASQTGTLKTLLAVMTVNMAITFPSNVFDVYIASQERFTFQKLIIIVSSLLTPVITVPLLLRGFGSIAAAVCMTAVTLLKLITNALYCIKYLKMRFIFSFDSALLKELSVFSFFIFLNIISDQINWNTDKTILGIFKGSESVTRYSIGSQLNGYFLSISYALCSLLTPRAHTLVAEGHDNAYLTRFFTRFGKAQFIIMSYIFIMLIAAGKPFIRLWSGLQSDIPYFTALILTAPVLITSAQSIGIEIQRAKDLHRFRSIVYILIASVNIIISIPLCIKFGEIGCALGTCIGLTAGNIIIMNIYYHKRMGLDVKYFWRNVLSVLPSFIPCIILICLFRYFPYDGITYIISCAAAVTAVYMASVYFIGLSKKERRAVKHILLKK